MIDIDNLIKQAILEKNSSKKSAYRAIKAELLIAQSKKNAEPITEGFIIKTIKKLISQKEESIALYNTNNRQQLAKEYQEENKYLKELLPPEISKDELTIYINNKYNEGISKKDMGKVIKDIKQVYPTADGKIISEIVKLHIV